MQLTLAIRLLLKLSGIVLASFLLSVVAMAQTHKRSCESLISLAPSVTEMLFYLDFGSRVKAVTRYCNYPKEALSLPRLGGLFDYNLEAASLLNPSLAFGLLESKNSLDALTAMGVDTLALSDRSVQQIIKSMNLICQTCGCSQAVLGKIEMLYEQTAAFELLRKDSKQVRVAVIVASSISSNSQEFYLSGRDGFYSSIFDILKLQNVIEGDTISLPTASFETLLALKPDLIFVVESDYNKFVKLKNEINNLMPKVKLELLSDDFAVVPGPRFILLLKKIYEYLGNLE